MHLVISDNAVWHGTFTRSVQTMYAEILAHRTPVLLCP